MISLVTRPSYIQERLRSAGIEPSKSLGQNFLADGNILDLIIQEADLSPADHVLEIGPGLGALTVSLLRHAGRVTCIEKDEKLAELLREEMATRSHFHCITGDALDVDLNALLDDGVTRIVSNLPYSVGTRIAMQLLQAARHPERMIFMLQQDVAEKFAAVPGGKTFGLTAVWSQILYQVDTIHTVSPRCFIPPPRIASAVLRMIRREDPEPLASRTTFEQVSRFAFEHRRKQLAAILSRYDGFPGQRDEAECLLNELNIASELRPEALAPDRWVQLANRLAEFS